MKIENLSIKNHLHHLGELFRFGIVGGAATVTHLGVAYLLSTQTSLPLILVNICAFCVAFGVSFMGHYHWTFGSKGGKKESFIKFFVVALTGLGFSTALLALLIKMDISTDLVKLVISIFIIPIVTYILSKTWAFRHKKA